MVNYFLERMTDKHGGLLVDINIDGLIELTQLIGFTNIIYFPKMRIGCISAEPTC